MRRVLALALAGVALVLSGPAGSAPSWGAPVQVSTGDRALGPELSVSTSGESLVVWDQEVGSDCATVPAALSCIHIVEAASRSAGSETWGAPKEISRPGVGSTPRAAVDASGAAAILWVHDIGRDRVLQASYRKGSSGAFPEPNDISEPRLAVTSHHVALDGAGNVVTVWAERPSTTFVVRSATRSALTGAWSSAVTLSRPGADVSAGPALAMTPDGVASRVERD